MARRRLRDYQQRALEYFLSVDHPALFIEMRLGKTLTTIRGIMKCKAKKVLIAGPYGVFYGWLRELAQEKETQYGVTILDGETKERFNLLNDGLNRGDKYFLMSKECHRWLPEVGAVPWDLVIVDESTYLMNPKSGVSKFYAKWFRNARKRVILTGSPDPEGGNLLNYVQQLQFLDPTIFGVKSYWYFRSKYCRVSGFHAFEVRAQHEKKLKKRLAEKCFFLKRSDVNLGGEKVYEPRGIRIPKKVKRTIRILIEEFIVEWDGKEINSTEYAPVKYMWLRRLFGGFLEGEFVFDGKINEVKELLAGELSGQQVVIWSIFIEEINLLEVTMKKLGLRSAAVYGKVKKSERDKVERDFQDGKLDVAILHPACFKYGRDFSAANTVIYYSSPLGEARQQSEDRVISAAVKDTNLIIDLVCKGTIEEDIYECIRQGLTESQTFHRIIRKLRNGN